MLLTRRVNAKYALYIRSAGGTCNGPPGVRPQYFPTYYGAFILDPEGRNIEAVCFKPGFWAEEWSTGIKVILASVAVSAVGAVGYWWDFKGF